ncbi:MAG: methyltransferase domain-containing protein [Acidimicrobiales bacterium]|nr:methyltransferase domain-containing protein [Acidimicrobiales bacterium]
MTRQPDGYLHGHHDSVLRSHRWRTAENSAAFLLPHLSPTHRVLDVGCGPGTITLGLATRVPHGEVVGVDASEEVLDQARSAAAREGRTNVAFETGDAYALRFEAASFDVVFAHQLLQHLSDPPAALAELGRVCRPGGLVAARDADYGAMFWYPASAELEEWRALYQKVARAIGGEPDAGRRMLGWARSAGFRDVTASAGTWCFADPSSRDWWGRLWAERLTASRLAEHARHHAGATPAELERLAAAFLRWAATEDACFVVPHGEVLCRR